MIQGGNFIRGFMSSFASTYLQPLGRMFAKGSYYGRAVFSALTGGTVSLISGGKFANGAVTSAFQFVFNEWGHDVSKKVRGFLGSVERRAQMYKAEYNKATNKLTVLLVDKALGRGSSLAAGAKIVFDLNKKHIGYPAGFAKKAYTGGVGALWKILKGGKYPGTILVRGAGGFLAGYAGSYAYDLGQESVFYFKAYRDELLK